MKHDLNDFQVEEKKLRVNFVGGYNLVVLNFHGSKNHYIEVSMKILTPWLDM